MAREKKFIPTDDLSVPEFKEKVIEYFEERNSDKLYGRLTRLKEEGVNANQDKIDETMKKIRDLDSGKIAPITIPGLALHLNWSVEKLVEYPPEGKFAVTVQYARTKCESFLLDSMFSGKVDKGIANMMLIKYFGYNESGKRGPAGGKGGAKRTDSIADIVNRAEANVAAYNAKRNKKSKQQAAR